MADAIISAFTPSLMSHQELEKVFVQREWLAKELVEKIILSATTLAKHYALLVGMRGIGKTHLVALVYHRLLKEFTVNPALKDKLVIAWLREEEWGVDSWLDFVNRILRAMADDDPKAAALWAELRRIAVEHSVELAAVNASRLLREAIGDRTLLLIMENLDDLFKGLGLRGQQQFRSFLQEEKCCTILATTPGLFEDVESREKPFFGSFNTRNLDLLSVPEAIELLEKIATLGGQEELAVFLRTAEGRSRVRAVHHLAGGNPRVYMLFSQFISRDSLDSLVQAFMKMLDDLTPYYQARMKELSNQQRKIVELLVDRRQPLMVKEIAGECFIDAGTAGSQLRVLRQIGYVEATQDGRDSLYELREVLMRLCLEVKKFRGRWVELILDFLKVWYRPEQRRGLLERFGDSKLIGLEDLRSLAESEDDLVAKICLCELKKFLSIQNAESSLQTLEELLDMGVLSDGDCEKMKEFIQQNKFIEALEYLAQKRTQQPEHQKSLFHFNLCLHGLGFLLEEKFSSYKRANEITPDESETLHGIILSSMGFHEKAIASYERAIEINPDKHSAWNNRGIALENLGRHEEAIVSFGRVIEINPDNYSAWHNNGYCYFKWKKCEQALECYNSATKIRPNRYNSWHCKGVTYFVIQNYVAAFDSWQQTFSYVQDPDVPRYCEVSVMIQEFIEELIPRFTQIPADFLPQVLALYQQATVLNELGTALIKTLPQIIESAFSNTTADQWLALWQQHLGHEPALQMPLRLMTTAIAYKNTPDKQKRLWLGLAKEERSILDQALGFNQEDGKANAIW